MGARIAWSAFLVAALVTPLCAQEQTGKDLRRVGFLGPSAASSPLFEELRSSLAHSGFEDGRNVRIETRWPAPNRLDQLPELALELADMRPDAIVAIGATAARAAVAATASVPIVFEIVVDPVEVGLVSNMDKPGGNVTGVTTFDPEQARKQLELLNEALPGLRRVALIGDDGAVEALFVANVRATAALGLEARTFKVSRQSPDFDAALRTAKEDGAGAVIVISTPVTTANRRAIAVAAMRYRIPTLSPIDHADAGGLISFGSTFHDSTRRAAGYVAKILQGARAADLPVEVVKRQELVINLGAARRLGISLPDAILHRADRILEP